ncbi:MAG: hypothetical protein WCO66_03560 [Candidatus Absconditabacteria bacterium]
MNKTFLVCCSEKTAEELRAKGIESKDGLIVVNNHEDLAKQIKKTCGSCSVFLEDIYKDAKVGDPEHITEIAQRIIKMKTSASIIILQEDTKPFHPNLFKGSLSQEGLRMVIKN